MYSAEEVYDNSDLEFIRNNAAKKENFTLIKNLNKKQTLTIAGYRKFEPDDGFLKTWNGKDYLIHFSEDHNLPNNWGGFGYATEKTDWLEDYEKFCEYLNRNFCRHAPGYSPAEVVQLTLF